MNATLAARGPIPDALPVGHDADEPLVSTLLEGLHVIEAAHARLARAGTLQARADELLAAVRPAFTAATAPQVEPPAPLVLGLLARETRIAERRAHVLGFADATDLLKEVSDQIAEECGPAAAALLDELRSRFTRAAVDRIGVPGDVIRRDGKG